MMISPRRSSVGAPRVNVKARTAAMNTLKQISVNAPSVVREPGRVDQGRC